MKASWDNEARACMDYLHAHVIDDQFEAACLYEYARRSEILREAAAERDALIRRRKQYRFTGQLYDDVAQTIDERHNCGTEIIQYPWALIWRCRSFPAKPYNQISKSERANILRGVPVTEIQPLHMTKSKMLASMGVFDDFSSLDYPIHHKDQWTYALFTLDFTETKNQMARRFEKWLELLENKQRLAKYRRDTTGKTGIFKDRLKDLAVWQLYDKLGFAGMLKFTNDHRKRSQTGEPMPFHDARKGQAKKVPLNQAPLCSEESFPLKAKARAQKYLTNMLPFEFGLSAGIPKRNKFIQQINAACKISKSLA